MNDITPFEAYGYCNPEPSKENLQRIRASAYLRIHRGDGTICHEPNTPKKLAKRKANKQARKQRKRK